MKIRNFLLSLIILTFLTHNALAAEKKTAAENKQPVSATNEVTAEDLYKILPGDVVQGHANAKVTVIEYASLTCSHCADFHKGTYPELKEKYIDTNKIKFIFRSFPLDEPALRGSMLASCAGPERFYKFLDVMFTTQSNWSLSKNYLEVLANIGKLGGLSGEEFDKCMANTDLEKKIMQGKFDASKVLSVRATPTFFINGNIYKGAHNFEYFSKVIDEALESAEKTKEVVPAKNKGK